MTDVCRALKNRYERGDRATAICKNVALVRRRWLTERCHGGTLYRSQARLRRAHWGQPFGLSLAAGASRGV